VSPGDDTFTRVAVGLAQSQRTPVCAYIYDISALREWAQKLVACLPDRCRLFYAMKANADAVVLAALAPIVHGFETASIGEVRKARAASGKIPVVFGGPGKTEQELEEASARGVELLHVESISELYRIECLGARAGARIGVLLRVNLRGPLPAATLRMAGVATQFGIDESELPRVLAAARACSHVDVKGFHLHCLSNSLDAAVHLELIQSYLDRVARWEALLGRPAEVLNVGGGIGVNYADPRRVFDWPGFCSALQALLERSEPRPELVFECGRFITAACGAYAAEVLDLKHNHGKAFAIVRGGTHHFRLPASWQHSHPFRIVPVEDWPHPFERAQVIDQPLSVAGQLCSPKDLLARDAPVERVRVGDILLFTHAGAYGWSISHHDFLSHPHPEVIHVH
jgi:2-[(L-alanin-3-ylcarbamoyl)methyl]-2-hydroxybutanedioate decarboxylase